MLLFTSLYFSDPSGLNLFLSQFSPFVVQIKNFCSDPGFFLLMLFLARISLAVSVTAVLKVVITESMSVSSLFIMMMILHEQWRHRPGFNDHHLKHSSDWNSQWDPWQTLSEEKNLGHCRNSWCVTEGEDWERYNLNLKDLRNTGTSTTTLRGAWKRQERTRRENSAVRLKKTWGRTTVTGHTNLWKTWPL